MHKCANVRIRASSSSLAGSKAGSSPNADENAFGMRIFSLARRSAGGSDIARQYCAFCAGWRFATQSQITSHLSRFKNFSSRAATVTSPSLAWNEHVLHDQG